MVPDSLARTVAGLARYIGATFKTEDERARAAFVWVARNIRYDYENRYLIEFKREPAIVAQETLDKRRGVCRHYAELYCALANQLGLKTYVVPGYVSLREPVGHAWCATRIAGQWYLMEPTWALERRFVNGKPMVIMRDDYYRMTPAQAIESHMPYDPLWQLLRAPRTPEQFQYGLKPTASTRPFAYLDSLAAYEQQSPLQRLHATNRRVEQNGVKSGLIFHCLVNSRNAEERCRVALLREQEQQRVELVNQQNAVYNQALKHYNASVDEFNSFVDLFNRQFQPRKTDAELAQLLPPVAANLAQARQLLLTARFDEPSSQVLANDLTKLIQEAEAKLQPWPGFMERHLRTGKLMRPMLFTNLGAMSTGLVR